MSKLLKNPYLWLILTGLAVYFQTLFFGYVYLDDNYSILNNQHFIGNIANFFELFRTDVFFKTTDGAYYRPIPAVICMANAVMMGTNPFIYHFTNVLLHLAVVCLLYSLLTRLKYSQELSFLAALFFAVHPALSQAIAWLAGQVDVLLAVFILPAFIYFIDYLRTHNLRDYGKHLFFFLLAMFTKELTGLFPCLLVLYIFLIYKGKVNRVCAYSLGLGWFTIILFYIVVRKLVLGTLLLNNSYSLLTFISRLPALFVYLGKIIWPFNLSVYPVYGEANIFIGALAALFLVGLVIFSKSRRINYVLFGLTWFLVFLIPSFLQPGSQPLCLLEHRVYLPLIGLIIVLLEIDIIKNFKAQKRTGVSWALVLLGLAIINVNHSLVFKDRLSFWQSAVRTSPGSAFCHNNLGSMYYLSGSFEAAEKAWKKAVAINPREGLTHGNLGLIYMNSGRFAEAEKEYREELKNNPLYDNAYYNYGLLCYKEGRLLEAEKLWLETIKINPDYIDAYGSLVVYNCQTGKKSVARRYVLALRKKGIKLPAELLNLCED